MYSRDPSAVTTPSTTIKYERLMVCRKHRGKFPPLKDVGVKFPIPVAWSCISTNALAMRVGGKLVRDHAMLVAPCTQREWNAKGESVTEVSQVIHFSSQKVFGCEFSSFFYSLKWICHPRVHPHVFTLTALLSLLSLRNDIGLILWLKIILKVPNVPKEKVH